MGGFPLKRASSTVSLEITMSRMHSISLPVALFCSALAISACATKPQEAAVAEPAPAAVASAPETAPAASTATAEQPAAPAVVAEQPASKPAVKKAKKKVPKVAPPKAAPVEPVAAPAPVVKQEAPVAAPQEPAAPAVVAQPVQQAATPGFLEKYWMWLLGVVVAAIAFFLMKKKD
jgi:outer membrane biosynthesis protein TonB